jgi:alpha-L-rhamnosidase
MNSHNHVMLLGDLIVWYYECLAGIRNDPSGAGFERIVMHPYPIKGLDFVDAGFNSVRGLIRSSWTRHRGRFYWALIVPCNSTATVYIPAESKDSVIERVIVEDENGISETEKPAASQPEIKFLRMENGCAVFEIGSGEYLFVSEIPK